MQAIFSVYYSWNDMDTIFLQLTHGRITDLAYWLQPRNPKFPASPPLTSPMKCY